MRADNEYHNVDDNSVVINPIFGDVEIAQIEMNSMNNFRRPTDNDTHQNDANRGQDVKEEINNNKPSTMGYNILVLLFVLGMVMGIINGCVQWLDSLLSTNCIDVERCWSFLFPCDHFILMWPQCIHHQIWCRRRINWVGHA